MRILFITDNYPPEVNAPARRTFEHCREWVQSGDEVTVITCWPNFPRGEVYEGYRNKMYGRTDEDGIRVKRVWSYMARNEGFVKRSLDYLSFAIMAFFVGLFSRCDVVVATSPQFFTTFAARGISFVRRKPWVFELRDIWPESIQAVGAMKKGRLYRFLEWLELSLYRSSSRVLAVTPAFKTNLMERGIDGDKIDVVPNGVNRDDFPEVEKDSALVDDLGLADKFVVGYIGTHGMAHALDFVLECAERVEDPRVHFLFVGDGAEKPALVRMAAEQNLSNVTFCDPVGADEVARYVSVSDTALVPLRKSDTFLSVIPSKIFESASMAKPILLGVDGQARSIIEEHAAGCFFEPENSDAFLAELARLSDDPELYARCQQGCRELADAYDRRKLAQKAKYVIESTCM